MPAVKFIERLDLEQVSVDSEISHFWTDTRKTRAAKKIVLCPRNSPVDKNWASSAAGIGVTLADERITRMLGIDGVLIVAVDSGSPADHVGLQPTRQYQGDIILGDIIYQVNGKKISSPMTFPVNWKDSMSGMWSR